MPNFMEVWSCTQNRKRLCRSRGFDYRARPTGKAPKGRYGKKQVCRVLRSFVTWTGLAAIGALALPAGILALLMAGIGGATDRLAAYLSSRVDE